ncbi:cobalamin 5'-phosphate synthase/cobalamin synthase [Thermoplasmatales archaeon BRNA1]|nr:cobalamin 5'-phosphate synthase/cobalamin synthase [Thermoplasmatales archaeon BRNA1]
MSDADNNNEYEVQEQECCQDSEDFQDSQEQVSEEKPKKSSNPVPIVDAIKGMLSFFTIFKLNVGERESDAMEKNFWLVPIIGFIIGLAAFIVVFIIDYVIGGLFIEAVAAIATVLILSKFLHFDGLADFGDGMVASGDKEKHVRALKDTTIGAGGLGVAFIVTMVSIACYTGIPWGIVGVPFIVLGIEAVVKNAQVVAAAFGEPSDGMAGKQVAETGMNSMILSTILAAVFMAIAVVLGVLYSDFDFGDVGKEMAVMIIVPVLASVLVGFGMAKIANRTFGFVNGDILGATNEIARAVSLLLMLFVLGLIWL